MAAAQATAQLVATADTVHAPLPELEARFLERNFSLLAARYNIDASKAAIEQARLWNNPNISVEQMANAGSRPPFDFTRTGNTDIAVSQLFLLAGKRSKQVQLATINQQVAEHQLADLLRALRYELRSDFYDLYYLQRAVAFDDRALASVGRTIAASEKMYASRSILLSEVVRLRSLLLAVQTERLGYLSQIRDLEGSLRVLLRDEGTPVRYYVPTFDPQRLDSLRVDTLSIDAAIATATTTRPDVRIAVANVDYESANLSLQRALRTPDVTVGGHYSRNGSYIPDYFGVTVAVDLPVFNRNQGNIKVSEYTLEGNRRLATVAAQKVEREVLAAFQKASDADRMYHELDRGFAAEYDKLVTGTTKMYEQRDITIIQYADFFDSYRQTIQQLNQLESGRIDALEALNFAAGQQMVTP
jgi:cobalt-zinc-cadmium efflux system outer membrane protein